MIYFCTAIRYNDSWDSGDTDWTPIGKYIEKPLIFAGNENQGLLCNTDYSFTVPSGLNRGRGSR